MNTKWNDTSWQKEFLEMKAHSPSDAKLLMGGVKGLKGAWRLGVLHVEYERLKKNTRAAATMKEETDWKKELIESGRFNDQFSKGLLENGAKNFMQGIYLGYMYSRWRKIRGLDKDDPEENKGQMQSSYKEFEKKIK